jgi:hypothetical protein
MRRQYERLRRQWYYEEGRGGGTAARRRFFMEEMGRVAARLRVAMAETERRSDVRVAMLLEEREHARATLREALQRAGIEPETIDGAEEESLVGAEAAVEGWGGVRAAAAARGAIEDDCAVCLQPLLRRAREEGTGDAVGCDGTPGDSGASVLSCGHIFHTACVQSLERFQADAGRERSCPVCRGRGYRRAPWTPPTPVAQAAPEPSGTPEWLQEPASPTTRVDATVSDAVSMEATVAAADDALAARQRRNAKLQAMLDGFSSRLDSLGSN